MQSWKSGWFALQVLTARATHLGHTAPLPAAQKTGARNARCGRFLRLNSQRLSTIPRLQLLCFLPCSNTPAGIIPNSAPSSCSIRAEEICSELLTLDHFPVWLPQYWRQNTAARFVSGCGWGGSSNPLFDGKDRATRSQLNQASWAPKKTTIESRISQHWGPPEF